MKFVLLIMMILPLSSFALEVDEKLTVRVLKTSETRKTILINRGTEDGIVEGDHARFLVTAGIVARAVAVRVSPTRSVWSVYRLVNADFLVNDSVMTLKITPPVKITKDETQALVQEDVPTRISNDPTTLGIPLADGAQDLGAPGRAEDDEDLMALDLQGAPASLVERNREIFGLINISALSASTTSASDDSFESSQASQHIGLGFEYYPRNEREWYSRFSLIGSFNIMKQDNQSYNGASSTNDLNEFSVGLNWHPMKLPSQSFGFIPFIHASFNMGSVKSTYSPGSENTGGPEHSSNGSTNGFSVGGGIKYYTNQGLGARMILDYYLRNETYEEDSVAQNEFTKSVRGPRLMVALSYRF